VSGEDDLRRESWNEKAWQTERQSGSATLRYRSDLGTDGTTASKDQQQTSTQTDYCLFI